MITKSKRLLLGLALAILSINFIYSQDQNNKTDKSVERKLQFLNHRGPNAIDVALGTAIINGDLSDPIPEIYFRIGYKQHISSHLNLNLTFNKYNLAFKDLYNEGFLSVDFNLELLLSPYKKFTPYFFAGYGYNASNYFESTTTKAQGGFGIETIVANRIGLKLFGEYNYAFSDELDGLVAGASDDTFFRIGLGMNIYFGGNKKKEALNKEIKTIINSNPIIPDS